VTILTEHCLAHRFDLLGSGRVRVKYGMSCNGVEGHRYDPAEPVSPDPDGRWLQGRVTPANLPESRRIWALVDPGYEPIDWQLDFKSGFRWSATTWCRDVAYGHMPGVDVKVPWELARLQHLPQLALAHALLRSPQKHGERTADEAAAPGASPYAREFRNQTLDFVAANPPRFGVNWVCAMDVGIRVANCLVAHDLFRAHGVRFDPEFESVLARSVYEHARHIVDNLEWSRALRSNHYLADVVGLLFAAAHLPRSPETDAWLAFAVQELVAAVREQFHEDGSNFEASTCYHRLSAEMAIYATALVLGLPDERLAALREYDCRRWRRTPPLAPAPIRFEPLPDGGRDAPFPNSHFERLEKAARFVMRAARPDGCTPQFGDNDSGRFLKLQPALRRVTAAQAKAEYVNLEAWDGPADDAEVLMEDQLDHRHLVAAANGMFEHPDLAEFAGPDRGLETEVVLALARNAVLRGARTGPTRAPGEDQPSPPHCAFFPDFGLYVYRVGPAYLAVRCGDVGQNGNAGHTHNDQLSFELAIDRTPVVVDPGTYLYTPLPEQRNLFRSTAMHSVLTMEGEEQNRWAPGRNGLFSMLRPVGARLLEAEADAFAGEHSGFGPPATRRLRLEEGRLDGLDSCGKAGARAIAFHLAPQLRERVAADADGVTVDCPVCLIRFTGGPGRWSVRDCRHSPAYGVLERTRCILLETEAEEVRWSITWGDSR